MIIGIDPGIKYVAWAASEESSPELLGCGFLFLKELRLLGTIIGCEARVLVEGQYVDKRSKVDPADILELAAVRGACLALGGPESSTVLPADWKGQLPKDVLEARVMNMLTGPERDVFDRSLKGYVGPSKKPPHRSRRGWTADMRCDVVHAIGIMKHAHGWRFSQ